MALYFLDSNVFIQAHRSTYPLDIATGFWNKIEELARSGVIASIDKVKKELFCKNDELRKWCEEHLPTNFFKDTSEAITEYRTLTAWAVSKSDHYLQKAIAEFLDADEADAFLIAYAMVDPKNRIIITQEISDPKIKIKIKIPEPCDTFNIMYMNIIKMFRKIGETF